VKNRSPAMERVSPPLRTQHRRLALFAARACQCFHPGPVNRGVEMSGELLDGLSFFLWWTSRTQRSFRSAWPCSI